MKTGSEADRKETDSELWAQNAKGRITGLMKRNVS